MSFLPAPAVPARIAAAALALLALPAPSAGFETADCIILPEHDVALASPARGLLASVDVARMDRVRAGQLVAELAAGPEKAALALARHAAEDDGAVKMARVRRDHERAMLDRAEALAERQVLSDQALAERRAEFALREAELARAETERARAALEVDAAEAQLEQRRLRSPIDGVVAERLLDPGEFAREDTPVLRIVSLAQLKVEVILPQALRTTVLPGVVMQIHPDGAAGPPHAAAVVAVDPVIDPASGTFGATLLLDNADGVVAAGINCTAISPNG